MIFCRILNRNKDSVEIHDMRLREANKTKFLVCLPESDREALVRIIQTKGTRPFIVLRAKLLLLSNEGMTDLDIGKTLGISKGMMREIRKKYVLGGIQQAIYQKAVENLSVPEIGTKLSA